MSRIVKCAHIQASNAKHDGTPAEIKEAMIRKHIPLIEEAGEKGAQILCLQEIFYGPYFCAEQDIKWYQTAEKVPGPTVERLAEFAKKYRMVLVIPVYEMEIDGVYYNTAAVVDADAAVILTEWNAFRGLDLERLASSMRNPLLIDFRNLFSLSDVGSTA